jgi:peroxiredoxin
VLAAGAPAPEFTLRRQDGSEFTRADLMGKTTVLVFYPNAFSSVCSDQFQIYNEVLADFSKAGAVLYGISCDHQDSQEAFRVALGVDIAMLSDFHPKGAVTKAFDVWFEPAGFPNRGLAIIGPDGAVKWSWEGEHPGVLPGANLIFDGLAA